MFQERDNFLLKYVIIEFIFFITASLSYYYTNFIFVTDNTDYYTKTTLYDYSITKDVSVSFKYNLDWKTYRQYYDKYAMEHDYLVRIPEEIIIEMPEEEIIEEEIEIAKVEEPVIEEEVIIEEPIQSEITEEPIVEEVPVSEPEETLVASAVVSNPVYDQVISMTYRGAGVTDAHINTIVSYYGLMPDVIRNYIAANNMQIMVDAYGTYTEGHAGMCYMNNGVVPSVINLSCQKKGQLEMAVIHEFGHAIDNLMGVYYGYTYNIEKGLIYNCISNSDEFQALYYEECPTSGYGSWATYASWEYFAESFRWYFENRSKVPPKTCAYMSRILTDFFGTPL